MTVCSIDPTDGWCHVHRRYCSWVEAQDDRCAEPGCDERAELTAYCSEHWF